MAPQVRVDGGHEPNLKGDVADADGGGLNDAHEEGRTVRYDLCPNERSGGKNETPAVVACEETVRERREDNECCRSGNSITITTGSSSSSGKPSNTTCRNGKRRDNSSTSPTQSNSEVRSGTTRKREDLGGYCGVGSRNAAVLGISGKVASSSVSNEGLEDEEENSRLLAGRHRSKEEARKAVFASIAAWRGLRRRPGTTAGNAGTFFEGSTSTPQVRVVHGAGGPAATGKLQSLQQEDVVRRSPTVCARKVVAASAARASLTRALTAAAVPGKSEFAASHPLEELASVNTEGEDGEEEGGRRENRGGEEGKKPDQPGQRTGKGSTRPEKEALPRPASAHAVTTAGGGKPSARAGVEPDAALGSTREAGRAGDSGDSRRRRSNSATGGGAGAAAAPASETGRRSAAFSLSLARVPERSFSACLSRTSPSFRGRGSPGFNSSTSSTASKSSASSVGWFDFSSSRSGWRSGSRSSSSTGESSQGSMRRSASASLLFDSSGATPVSSSSTSTPAGTSPRQKAASASTSPFAAAFFDTSSSSSSSSSPSSRPSRASSCPPSEGIRTPPHFATFSPRRLAAAGDQGKVSRISIAEKESPAAQICAGNMRASNKAALRFKEGRPRYVKKVLSAEKTTETHVEEKLAVPVERAHVMSKAGTALGGKSASVHSPRRAPFLSRFLRCASAGAGSADETVSFAEKRNTSVGGAHVTSQQLPSTSQPLTTAASGRGGGATALSPPLPKSLSFPSCSTSSGPARASSASEASGSLLRVGGASGAAALLACEKTSHFSGIDNSGGRQSEGRDCSAKEGSNRREETTCAVTAKDSREERSSLSGSGNKSGQETESSSKSEKVPADSRGATTTAGACDAVEQQDRRNKAGDVDTASGGGAAEIYGNFCDENTTQLQDRKHGGTTGEGRPQHEDGGRTSRSSGSGNRPRRSLSSKKTQKESKEVENRQERQPQQEGSFSALRAAGGLLKRFSFSSSTEEQLPTLSPLKRVLTSILSSSSSSNSTDGECAVEPPGRPPCPTAVAECKGVAGAAAPVGRQTASRPAVQSAEKKSFFSYPILRTGTLGGDRKDKGRREKRRGRGGEKDATRRLNVRLRHLPMELLQAVFQCLTVEEILRVQVVCTEFYTTIREKGETFAFIRKLKLDRKWARMDATERQGMLLQMQALRHIYVSSNAFTNGSITIQEIAALVSRNADTLRYLCLHSPDNPLHDETPVHAPFAFRPHTFGRLRMFALVGCQGLEWAHIFSNCCFPSVERFEITYFPVQSDHWSWQVLPDFTGLGLSGLHRMLDSMPTLERLTIGLEVRHEEDNRMPGWDFDFLEPEVDFFHDWPRTDAYGERRSRGAEAAYQLHEILTSVNGNLLSSGLASQLIVPAAPHAISGYSSGRAGAIGVEAGRQWMTVLDEEEERRRFTGVDPIGGRGRLKSWRGKISEEDFADLCAVAFVRAGAAGNLKRITIKHRIKAENEGSTYVTVSTFSDIFQGAAAFCYRYVSDVFTGLPGIRR